MMAVVDDGIWSSATAPAPGSSFSDHATAVIQDSGLSGLVFTTTTQANAATGSSAATYGGVSGASGMDAVASAPWAGIGSGLTPAQVLNPAGGGQSAAGSWLRGPIGLGETDAFFQWPDAPSLEGGPARPADAAGEPVAPLLDGPAFDPAADAQYVADIAAVDADAKAAEDAAKAAHDDAKNAVQDEYDAEINSAEAQKAAAERAAFIADTAAQNGHNPYFADGLRLQFEKDAADSEFASELDRLRRARTAAVDKAFSDYSAAEKAATDLRDQEIKSAVGSINPLTGGGSPTIRVADANYKFATTVANAKKTRDDAIGLAAKAYTVGEADLSLVRDNRKYKAQCDFDIAAQNSRWWRANGATIASQLHAVARAEALRDYSKAKALAEKNRDTGLAEAQDDFDVRVAEIRHDQASAKACAAMAAADRWVAAINTPWARYQAQVADKRASRSVEVSLAGKKAQVAAAAAIREEAIAKARSTHDKAVRLADAIAVQVIGRATAEAERATGNGIGKLSRTEQELRDVLACDVKQMEAVNRKSKTVADAALTRAYAAATAVQVYDFTVAAIERDYAKRLIADSIRTAKLSTADAEKIKQLQSCEVAFSSAETQAEDARYVTHTEAERQLQAQDNAREVADKLENGAQRQTVEEKVAKIDTDCEIERVAAEQDAAVSAAEAEQARVETIATAERDRVSEEAAAYQTEATADAQAWQAFVKEVTDAHVNVVNAWAAANPSAFTAYRASLARIARDRMQAETQAAVAMVLGKAEAYRKAVVDAANKDLANKKDSVAASVGEDRAVRNASIKAAKGNQQKIVEQAQKTSARLTEHDQAITTAGKQASDRETTATWDRNKAIHAAELGKNLDYVTAQLLVLFYKKEDREAGFWLLIDAAEQKYRKAVADAEGNYTIEMARINRDLTAVVANQDRLLTVAVGEAQENLAKGLKEVAATKAAELSGAGYAAAHAIAAAEETYAKAVAEIESAWMADVILFEARHDHAVVEAAAQAAVAAGEARALFEMARRSEYADLVATWANAQGTLHARFLADVARGDAAWATGYAPVFREHFTATVNAQRALLDGLIDDAAVRLTAEKDADLAWQAALAESARQVLEGAASAGAARIVAIQKAEGERQVALATATKNYNVARATANEAFENGVAQSGVTYAFAVVPAKKQWYIAGRTAAANAAYEAFDREQLRLMYDRNGEFGIQLERARGDADVAWRQEVGAADVTLAKAVAAEERKLSEAVAAAGGVKAASDRQAVVSRAVSRAALETRFLNASATAFKAFVEATAAADADEAADRKPVDIAFTRASAEAESKLRLAEAESAFSVAASKALASGSAQDRYARSLAAARRDYIRDFAPAYQAYCVALTQAAGDREAGAAAAAGSAAVAAAASHVRETAVAAAAMAGRQLAFATATGDYGVTMATLEGAHRVKRATEREAPVATRAEAEKAFQVSLAEARKEYAVAGAVIWRLRNGTNPPSESVLAGYQEARERAKAEADAAATYARAVAQADFSLAEAQSLANADAEFQADESEAFSTKQRAGADAERAYRHTLAEVNTRLEKDAALRAVQVNRAEVDLDGAMSVFVATAAGQAFVADTRLDADLLASLAAQFADPWLKYAADKRAAEIVYATQLKAAVIAHRQQLAAHAKLAVEQTSGAFLNAAAVIAGAGETRAKSIADASRDRDLSYVTSSDAYIAVVAPANERLQSVLASATRDRAVAVAAADRQIAVTSDATAKDAAYKAADEAYSARVSAARLRFDADRITALQTFARVSARSTHQYVVVRATADKVNDIARQDARRDYGVAEAAATEDMAVADAGSTRDYIVTAANAYAAAMQALVSLNGSTWAQAAASAAIAAAQQTIAAAGEQYDAAVAGAAAAADRAIELLDRQHDEFVAGASARLQSIITSANQMLEAALAVIDATPHLIVVVAPELRTVAPQGFTAAVPMAGAVEIPRPIFVKQSAYAVGMEGNRVYRELVAAMLSENALANDGYRAQLLSSEAVNRWIGNHLARQVLGDQWLCTPSSGSILGFDYDVWLVSVGGPIVVVGATLGSIALGGPILVLAAAACGGGYVLATEAINTYWYHDQLSIDFGNVVVGSVAGAVLAPVALIPGARAVLGTVGTVTTGYQAYTEFQRGRYVSAALNAGLALVPVVMYGRALRQQYPNMRRPWNYQEAAVGYKADDDWEWVLLRKGDVVVGGLPGQSRFYTDVATLIASKGDRTTLWAMLQVATSEKFGLRGSVGFYRVKRDTWVYRSKALANTQYGNGGGRQFYIYDYKTRLELMGVTVLNGRSFPGVY
jgi:hypothetical protein